MSSQQRIIVSRPGGLTVAQYKRRPKKTATENMATRNHFKNGSSFRFGWLKVSKTGLNTSGPYSGLRASSFNNPPMGPPSTPIGLNERADDARTGVSIGVADCTTARMKLYISRIKEVSDGVRAYRAHKRSVKPVYFNINKKPQLAR